MAEDDVAASPPSDHKRKLQDLEHEASQPPTIQIPLEVDDAYAQETALVAESSASPDVKRPCLDDPSGFFISYDEYHSFFFFLLNLVHRLALTLQLRYHEHAS